MSETVREKIKSYLELKKKDKVETMGTTIKDRHKFFSTQDEDFYNALRNILKTTDSDDEKYKNLLKELTTMWPYRIESFAETELMQFELLVDYENFTCLIVGTKEGLQHEVLQYFQEMLNINEYEATANDNPRELYHPIVLHPLTHRP